MAQPVLSYRSQKVSDTSAVAATRDSLLRALQPSGQTLRLRDCARIPQRRFILSVTRAEALGAELTFEILREPDSTYSLQMQASPTGASPKRCEPPLPPAPWSGPPLTRIDVPRVYRAEWQKAPNRSTCVLIAPRSLGEGAGAVPRAATFSGGWAVAYDRPELRSAFGVAGTGSKASDPAYRDWPHVRRWADSSSAEYGPEGGTGPNQLAYLRIAGQECLYNVWSRLSRAHLELLLDQLRVVE
jgi:hypothetical protein